MVIKEFHEITAWRLAHELTIKVYQITANFPPEEKFGLTSQIRRAAVSVPSNIAEGFKRKSKKDSCHFYNVAEGSLEEVKYQLYLAAELNYIDSSNSEAINELACHVGRALYGWKRHLEEQLET